MATINEAAAEFPACRLIAVTEVSGKPRAAAAERVGYDVFAGNPSEGRVIVRAEDS